MNNGQAAFEIVRDLRERVLSDDTLWNMPELDTPESERYVVKISLGEYIEFMGQRNA